MKDCLNQLILKEIGYEASLAMMETKLSNIDDMAVCLEFSGFSDKLFEYAEIVIDIILNYAQQCGQDETALRGSIEKKKVSYSNRLVNVENHASCNRMLYLLPHTQHPSRIRDVLSR